LAVFFTAATVLLADFLARLTAFSPVLTADFARLMAAVAPRDAVFAPARAVFTAAWATFVARPSAPPRTSAARTNFVSLRLLAMVPPFAADTRIHGYSTRILESRR
jgi:hypothetical protein